MAELDINDAEREVVALLGGEKLQSFGWNYKTGDLLPMPASLFRTALGIEILSKREPVSVVEPISKGAVHVIPIVRTSELFGFYKKLNPSFLIKFDASKWKFSELAINSVLDGGETSTSAQRNTKGAGRPRTHNWDLFYHEVVLYVDANCISYDGSMQPIRDHMTEWANHYMKPAPDRSQIKRMLKPIEDGWRSRNGSQAK